LPFIIRLILATSGGERLGLRLDQARLRRGRDVGNVFRQAFALIGVEDREAFEEGDGLGLPIGLGCAPAFVVGHDAIGIDDGGAALALSNIAAEPEGLAECEPALARETALDDGAPKDQNIDPRVAPMGGDVLQPTS
jgi:hypothetical protein